MKKNLKRIGIIIFILFVVLQNCCFADLIVSTEEQKKEEIEELMKFGLVSIEIIIVIVLMILILDLIFTSIKEKKLEEKADKELYECKKEKVKGGIYICIVFLIIISLVCFNKYTEFSYSNNFTYIIICCFIISIITRLIKRKKFSNIFYGIGLGAFIILITIGATIKINAEKFNSSFLQYVTDREYIYGYENIDDFLNELIENNKNNEYKINIFYKNENYDDNLEDLTERLVANAYSVEFTYYNYYIKEVSIKKYTPSSVLGSVSAFNSRLNQYEGNKVLGSSVKSLISGLISDAEKYYGMAEKLPDVYFYSDGGTDDIIATSGNGTTDIENYVEDLTNIKTKISNSHSYSHNYKVEMFVYDEHGYISEIVITY